MMAAVEEQKRRLRQGVKLLIGELEETYCQKADEEIYRRILSLPEYRRADTVFCFVGTSSEIDTVPVLMDAWSRGKRVCVPKCVGKGVMNAYRIDGMEDLREGSYGILEPGEQAVLVFPEEIDLVLAPCLSCSRDGRRLGYGGGYYDRYLGRVAAPKAVLCRSRVMREDIPVDGFDIPMDLVVCEDYVEKTAGFMRETYKMEKK